MIFITVGTHEQSFDRLVKYMDGWANIHDEDVIIQSGYTTYVPKYCKWSRIYSQKILASYIEKARIVVTHGGVSSIIAALQKGKIPIVVPRRKEFNEHVNNHQVEFCKKFAEINKNSIVVNDINDLGLMLENYDEISKRMKIGIAQNNKQFCKKIDQIVDELIE